MKRLMTSGYIFLLSVFLTGQDVSEYRIKEITNQVFEDMTDEESLISERREIFYYNGIGLTDRVETYRRNQVSNYQFRKTQDRIYTYDFQHRLVHKEWLEFSFPSEKPMSITTTNLSYAGKQVVLEEASHNDINQDFTNTETVKYNINGQVIERIEKFFSGDELTSEARHYYQWDENGCLVYSKDSTGNYGKIYEAILNDQCELVESKTYFFDLVLREFILYSTWKRERLTDDRGNIIQEQSFRKIEGTDTAFLLIEEVNYFYDEQDRDTLLIDLYIDGTIPPETVFGAKSHVTYDDKDQVVYSFLEEWDRASNLWLPSYETFITYDNRGNLINQETFRHYNQVEDKFMSYKEIWSKFNDDDQETYNYYREEDYSQEEPIVIETESFDFFACDKRKLLEINMDLITGGGFKNTYTYYDRPACETGNSDLSSIIVYPHPAQDYIHFHITNTKSPSEVSIYDISGHLLYSEAVHFGDFYSVDVSSLGPGMYVLQVHLGEEMASRKFVKF